MIGIDISKWQGEVDFSKLKDVEFIMIRLGYRKGFNGELILDPFFERNISEAKKHNIKVGVYFYSYALNEINAQSEAIFVIDKLRKRKLDFPIAFDLEDWKNYKKQKISLGMYNMIKNKFITTVEKFGYEGINYSSKYYAEHIWEDEKPIWLAHYALKTDFKNMKMWQATENGRIEGINSFVDFNVWYK